MMSQQAAEVSFASEDPPMNISGLKRVLEATDQAVEDNHVVEMDEDGDDLDVDKTDPFDLLQNRVRD